MKRSFNKLVLMAIIAAITAIGTMAQDEKSDLYNKFTACYRTKVIAEIDPCIAVGKDYLQKFGVFPEGTPPDDFAKFVKAQVDKLPKKKEDLITAAAFDKFKKGFETKNWKDTFDGGKEYISRAPNDSLDVMLILATIAFERSFNATPDLAYKTDGINLAKMAIQKIESGTTSQNWGGTGNLSYKNKDNALAWMNFTVARLTADTNKDTTQNLPLLKDAAPYAYKSLQTTSDIPKDVALATIGRYYLEELNASVDAYEKTCKNLTEDTEDCKRIRGTQLAYAERGADAYSRAYKAVSDDPKLKTFKDGLLKKATEFYNIRFKKTEGVNDFVSKAVSQPLVNPTTPITPVPEEPAPATTTTPAGTGTAPNGTKPPVTPVPSSTKPPTTPAKPPATTPATTPASNTTKPAATTPPKPAGSKGAVAKKTPVKKKAGR